ncbi:homoserine kinase [Haladaptatus caseinilyticus]|uniref:homoserine kinase n=1 Tax=Haladaptatus caseinilyticus TaxID=2993314 RepID=UPI00224A995E|nr:homoserine kinase [Haladaptatus caseinilyticus]
MVTVRAPATSANLGSGFDVFGLALERPGDVVRVERAPETTIEVIGVGQQYIPEDPAKNTAGIVAKELDAPAHIEIDKGVRPSSGLGSSAASAAAAAVALNELYDCGLTPTELVRVAAEGEAAVSGEAHADNVAPAILGGFTVVSEDHVTQVDTSIPVVACLPEIVVSTRDARQVVPQSVAIDELVGTVGDAATLTAGMFRNDPTLVGQGLRDNSLTGSREPLIDGFDSVRESALDAGATGVAVSGAGPSMLAICHEGTQAEIASAMLDAFFDVGVEARAYQTSVGGGATIVRKT